eukprot:scaffold29563_cov177-Skeletonema_menzelii.AAC.1
MVEVRVQVFLNVQLMVTVAAYACAASSCTSNSDMSFTITPAGGCVGLNTTVAIDNVSTKCPGGWYLERPSTCTPGDGVTNFNIHAACVAGGAAVVNIHTSCSEPIGLCDTFGGGDVILKGYQIFNSADQTAQPWYYDNCST